MIDGNENGPFRFDNVAYVASAKRVAYMSQTFYENPVDILILKWKTDDRLDFTKPNKVAGYDGISEFGIRLEAFTAIFYAINTYLSEFCKLRALVACLLKNFSFPLKWPSSVIVCIL